MRDIIGVLLYLGQDIAHDLWAVIEGVLPLVVLGQAQQVSSLHGHQLIGSSTADVHIAPDRPARLRRTTEDATGHKRHQQHLLYEQPGYPNRTHTR